MTNREQAIKRVAEAFGWTEETVNKAHRAKQSYAAYAVDTTEKLLAAEARVLELEAALKEILGYDGGAINALEDEYVMERAHTALQPKGE